MPTTLRSFDHDHAGIRWFVSFIAVITLTLLLLFLMLVYPHIGG